VTPTLSRLVDLFGSKRVLVLGDAMLDSYVVGTSTRLCQEAPVPVVAVRDRLDCPGGAANTAVNLAALGCQVELLSVVGADQDGDRLRSLLQHLGVGIDLLTVSEARQTLSKQRIVNGDRLLARIDQGDTGPIPRHVERRLLAELDEAFVRADAVVISDYAYGVLTSGVIGRLRTLQQRFQHLIAVDARDLTRYRSVGVAVVKPNFDEARRLVGRRSETDSESRVALAAALGDAVLDLTGSRIAALTLDADGAVVVERGQPSILTRANPVDQANTAGAGDTYLAALTLALASGATTSEAATLAACAAGLVVRQAGTTVCSCRELRQEIVQSASAWVVPESTRDQRTELTLSGPIEERHGQDDPADVGERRAPALHQA
jgi:D-beta-D-heptose 7-phosphate kinase/D-beta-D-heptose 1-phosphate adenosyltransferase